MHSFLKAFYTKTKFFEIIFVPIKIFTTRKGFVRYYYFINICITSEKRDFVLIRFLPFNLIITKPGNFFTRFIYGEKFLKFS